MSEQKTIDNNIFANIAGAVEYYILNYCKENIILYNIQTFLNYCLAIGYWAEYISHIEIRTMYYSNTESRYIINAYIYLTNTEHIYYEIGIQL